MKTATQELYRSYIPKYPSYSPDGMGRDTYIKYNNGGMLSKNINVRNHNDLIPIHNHLKPLGKQAASFKYYSDGSGRDSYVLHESGGLEKNHKSLNEYQLKDFLRPETNQSKNFPRFSRNCLKTSMFKTRKEWNANSALRQIEKNIIVRLYDKEKPKFISKSKDLGFLYDYETIQKCNISNLPKISSPNRNTKSKKIESDKSEYFKCSINKVNNFVDVPKNDFSKTMNFFSKTKMTLNGLK